MRSTPEILVSSLPGTLSGSLPEHCHYAKKPLFAAEILTHMWITTQKAVTILIRMPQWFYTALHLACTSGQNRRFASSPSDN